MFRWFTSWCGFVLGLAGYGAMAAPMSLQEYMALRGPEPTAQIAYGPAASQYVEVFRPAGPGPFPVVVLVHGGCWQTEFGGIVQFRNMAGALAAEGIAVWNVEYRRVDETGGGFPGTYEDMMGALDALAANAKSYQLDLNRIAAVGHSAGGHLVQWASSRARIAASSPLYRPNPMRFSHVVSLGGINDLRAWTDLCGFEVDKLTGTASAARPHVFADTNPAELLPNGTQTTLITGELDRQVPAQVAFNFAAKAQSAGETVKVIVLPGAGHFDEAAATSPSWKATLGVIKEGLGMQAKEYRAT
jgi:acetyl esterase/lipase